MNSLIKTFFIVCIMLSLSSMITLHSHVGHKVLAQELNTNTKLLNVNIQVLNSGGIDLIGSLHVMSATTGTVKNANDITFPAGQTIIKIFEFSRSEIPEGSNFSVEVVYGDDFSKIVHGNNNQSNSDAEFISINIP